MYKLLATILAGAFLTLTAMLAVVTQEKAHTALGSIQDSSGAYLSTTTSATGVSTVPSVNVLTSTSTQRSGIFGSIIVTSAGSAGGSIDIYDATTSLNVARTVQATSSILIASIPSNATVGTYTFDTVFKYGLMMYQTGSPGTTTLTWKY